ncbi:MAG: HEAT repeat domain-containing protein [Gemmatimonadales bacterium]
MTVAPHAGPTDADLRAIEELLRVLVKSQRALQMYLPNNPMYSRALEQVGGAFAPVWGITGRLVLEIQEGEITWEGANVYRQGTRNEGLAWQLYKDGLRRLTLLPGVETEEIVRFLDVVNRSRLLAADAGDDLLTLLWEQDFVLVSYAFIEVLGEGIEFLQESDARERQPEPEQAQHEVSAAKEAPAGSPLGVIDPADFDSTPFFLEEAEIRLIQSDLDDEYRRDIRQAAIDALLDILEAQREPDVRREVVALLEDILPAQLSTGGFRAVARILRELRVIAVRAPGLDQQLHDALLSFEDRLSQPDILEQVFVALEDSRTRPSDEDVGEVLRELKPVALPMVLAHLGRTIDANVRRALEPSVEQLARAQPSALAALLDSGPSDVIEPAITLASRLGLSQLVPSIVVHLKDGSPAIRLAAVRALGEFATPTSVNAVETALDDDERAVRQAALSVLVSRGGSGGAVRRIEAMLLDGKDHGWERSERRTVYEAYGQLAGEAAIPKLQELLEPRGIFRRKTPPEVRACAIFALAKVHTFEARLLVDRFTSDKEAVVRSAANAALRDWIA